jgi:hypothetical protein
MDSRKVAICATAGFIFIFVFDWVFHGMLLKDVYEQTSHLWRAPEHIQMHMPFAILGQFVFAITAAILFTFGYQNTGRGEGVKFGFYLGSFMAGMHLVCYAYMPIPVGLIFAWMAGDYLKCVVLGVLYAGLHQPKGA